MQTVAAHADAAHLEVCAFAHFVAWAYKEGAGYRDSGDLFERMNGMAHRELVPSGTDIESFLDDRTRHGRRPVVLDEALCSGWRFMGKGGLALGTWQVAADTRQAERDAGVAAELLDGMRNGSPSTACWRDMAANVRIVHIRPVLLQGQAGHEEEAEEAARIAA